MFKKAIFSISIIALILLSACQSNTNDQASNLFVDPPVVSAANYTKCEEPRPEVCTQEYAPVCATKDTGVRCVTTPCPSSEQVTKSNACSACGDVEVEGYILGECE